MLSASDEPTPVVHHIGSERVRVRDDRLVIESPVDMAHWEVRTYRHTLINFNGRGWRIARVGAGTGRTVRYELEPWTTTASELTGPTCDYEPAFVKQRDREYSDRRRRGAVGGLLGLVVPTVGVLGSDTKRHIEERYGIHSVGATRASQYVEAVIVLASGTLLVIGALVPVLGYPAPWPLWPFALAALVLSPDLLMRYDRLIREEPYPPAFYQWVRPRKGGRS